MSLFSQGHALLIGVGDYQDAEWRAPITVRDAQGVADALRDSAVGAYPPDQVTLLCNQQATRAGVTQALENLAQQVKPSDTVFIFFCGHGALGDDDQYYFGTQDAVFMPNNQIKAGTGLSAPELIKRLRAIEAQKLLFIINACFSGHISPTLGAKEKGMGASPSPTVGLEILRTGEGRALITASRDWQFSHYSHSGQYTFFGQALIDGLRGQGVANSGGYIGLFELYQHLYRRVKEAALRQFCLQEPMLTLLQGVGPFPVALYLGATSHNVAAIQQTPPPDMAHEVVKPPWNFKVYLQRVKSEFWAYICGGENLTSGQANSRYVELLVRERIKEQGVLRTPPQEGPLSKFIGSFPYRLLLLGESGAGKTTLLKKLAVDAAVEALEEPQKALPIVVKLNFFDSQEHGFARLMAMVGNAVGLDANQMANLWRTQPCLFLLDGFNEVSSDCQEACALALQELMDGQRHGYVITSRPTVQSQKLAKQVQGIKVMDMVQLDDYQMEAFLKGYGAAGLYERMDEQLKGLTRNPFMLWALGKICAGLPDGELPTNKGQLYKAFVDDYIFEYREASKQPSPTRYDYQRVKRVVLAQLAFCMTAESSTRITLSEALEDQFIDWLDDVEKKNRRRQPVMPDNWNVDEFVNEVVGNGVLRRGENALEFMHQSVQDYFAAVYLNTLLPRSSGQAFDDPQMRRCLDEIAREQTDDRWDETMIMLAGLTSHVKLSRLVTELIPRDPFLAALCAAVQPLALPSHLTTQLIDTLASINVERLASSSHHVYSPLWEKVLMAYQQALPFAQKGSLKCAHLQHNLAFAYAKRPTGERAANLDRAISLYEQALRLFTPVRYSDDYAATQHHLGNAYRDLPTGDRRQNLVHAIKCYQEALRFRTPEVNPHDYAIILKNLGNAYAKLPTGDRAKKLVQAISCYEKALGFLTEEVAPRERAITQSHLGNAYAKLPTGEQSANLTQAIEWYIEALSFLTREEAPFEYARIQSDLGNAYRDLPTGHRGENLRQAIQCYQNALSLLSKEVAPYDYALIQSHLGNAYRDLPTGHRDKNLTQAIQCYQEALRFLTDKNAPYEYATIQSNLGHTYSSPPFPSGRGGEWASGRVGEWASGREGRKKAISCYQEALRFFRPEVMPHECRQTNRHLADLYFAQGEWCAALEAYQAAMAAGEQLYRASGTTSRATESAENIALYRHAAFAQARLGETNEALLTLERGKTRLLAEAWLERVPRPIGVPDELWHRFEQAAEAVRAAQSQSTTLPDNEWNPVQAYESHRKAAQTANAALDAAIQEVRHHAPDFLSDMDWPTIQALIPDQQTTLVAFCLTSQGTLAFIHTPPAVCREGVQVVDIPSFTLSDLRHLFVERDQNGEPIGGWLASYLRYRNEKEAPNAFDEWLTTVTHTLAQLSERLLAPLLAALPADTEHIIFLPSGHLFLFPLHAAPLPAKEGRLCDRYEISYAPSLDMLANSQKQATKGSSEGLLAVINPEENPLLLFSQPEGAAIASLFSEPNLYEGKAATKQAVIANLPRRAYVHFSCIGRYNWNEPLESGLLLADTRLTLAELLSESIDMSACRIVTLSAGETGIIDVTKGSPEEYLALSAGFMLAGVPCVLASLWEMLDLPTAILMERFYRNHLLHGMTFPAALRDAQQWVRDMPIRQVAEYVQSCFLRSKRGNKAELLKNMRHYQYRAQQNPNERPFVHPYYWAGLTVIGM